MLFLVIVFHTYLYTLILDKLYLSRLRFKNVFAYFSNLLSRIENLVDYAVFFGFFRIHIEVAVGIDLDFGERLRRILRKNVVDALFVFKISLA